MFRFLHRFPDERSSICTIAKNEAVWQNKFKNETGQNNKICVFFVNISRKIYIKSGAIVQKIELCKRDAAHSDRSVLSYVPRSNSASRRTSNFIVPESYETAQDQYWKIQTSRQCNIRQNCQKFTRLENAASQNADHELISLPKQGISLKQKRCRPAFSW